MNPPNDTLRCFLAYLLSYVLNFPWCVNLRCTGHVTISIERGNDRPATVYALSSSVSRERNQNSLSLMTEVSGNAKFDEDLHLALEENLSFFAVVQLKAVLNFVILKL